ncbi:MAG: Fic family protein [Clostridiales bacterium]|nr:Fic family protein [Clostridiales bacterium]
MGLIDNSDILKQIKELLPIISDCQKDELIIEPFTKDFSLRFCWSSNALEGNTLTLEETVSVLEYDEVQSGHTYSEYREAKSLYASVQKQLLPLMPREISEKWIRSANGLIMEANGEYRRKKVYIGTLVEAVHYPPDPERVPELMRQYVEKWDHAYEYGEPVEKAAITETIFEMLAKEHIEFESIHPFLDGNGRTGRMILNQRMINQHLLPIAIEPSGEYRRAFRRYEKSGDISLMVHVICKAEFGALKRMKYLMNVEKDIQE